MFYLYNFFLLKLLLNENSEEIKKKVSFLKKLWARGGDSMIYGILVLRPIANWMLSLFLSAPT